MAGPRTYTHPLGQFRGISEPQAHLWDVGGPRDDACGQGENGPATHTVVLARHWIYLFFFAYQHYNKMTVFKGLLYLVGSLLNHFHLSHQYP